MPISPHLKIILRWAIMRFSLTRNTPDSDLVISEKKMTAMITMILENSTINI